MILSILICTLPERKEYFDSICNELRKQTNGLDLESCYNHDELPVSIGTKRNELLQRAQGQYVCFIDDDDMISEDYISTTLEALKSNPDCLSLRGIMTTDGENPEIFEHSLRHSHWYENPLAKQDEIKYFRYPNHLNVIRADIAKQFKFPEKNYSEDFEWSKLINASGLLKNEVYIEKILYYYKYRSNK